MTLDEAIEHAKEVARTCDDPECSADHIQLAEWLRQARGADAAARWYTKKLRELEDENVRLRSCLSDDAENARQILGENAKLREYAKAYLASVRFSCEPCPYCAPDSCEPETLPLRDGCRLYEEMRELGIEEEL